MFNPFEEENSEHSQGPTDLPVSMQSDAPPPSPISFLQLDHLSDYLPEGTQLDVKSERKIQQFLKQMKSYSDGLQQRNLEIACELQKQRNKNKQLMSALNFLMTSEEEKRQNLEQRFGQMNENSSKLEVQQNRRQMVQSEVKALRLENTYLKDLILIANDNYQKLEEKNKQLLGKYSTLEQQHHKREMEMLRKTEQIKNIFASIVIERNDAREMQKKLEGQAQPTLSLKGGKKEHAQDAYRSIFMKTLKPRKQNIHKQI